MPSSWPIAISSTPDSKPDCYSGWGTSGCCTTGRRTVFRRCPDRRDARRAQDERRAVRRRPTGNPAPKRFLAQRSDIDAGPAPRCNELRSRDRANIARPHAKRVLASSKDAQMGLLDFHRARIAHSGVACNATLVDRAAVATEIAHRAVGRGQLGERAHRWPLVRPAADWWRARCRPIAAIHAIAVWCSMPRHHRDVSNAIDAHPPKSRVHHPV